MLRATSTNEQPKKSSLPGRVGHVRFPGICRHAELLGVHRTHLYQVLSGGRRSVSLLRRYNAIIARERGKR